MDFFHQSKTLRVTKDNRIYNLWFNITLWRIKWSEKNLIKILDNFFAIMNLTRVKVITINFQSNLNTYNVDVVDVVYQLKCIWVRSVHDKHRVSWHCWIFIQLLKNDIGNFFLPYRHYEKWRKFFPSCPNSWKYLRRAWTIEIQL